jgi:hypothetical protein
MQHGCIFFSRYVQTSVERKNNSDVDLPLFLVCYDADGDKTRKERISIYIVICCPKAVEWTTQSWANQQPSWKAVVRDALIDLHCCCLLLCVLGSILIRFSFLPPFCPVV